MRCRYLALMAKSGRTISHVLFSLRILEPSASLGCEAARTFRPGTFRNCTWQGAPSVLWSPIVPAVRAAGSLASDFSLRRVGFIDYHFRSYPDRRSLACLIREVCDDASHVPLWQEYKAASAFWFVSRMSVFLGVWLWLVAFSRSWWPFQCHLTWWLYGHSQVTSAWSSDEEMNTVIIIVIRHEPFSLLLRRCLE